MKKDLLICIAHHYGGVERLKYLTQVQDNFLTNYGDKNSGIKIIIDTNEDKLLTLYSKEHVEVVVHKNLEHPFYLTWQHRFHILRNLDYYEYFAYFEDDMLLSYENYLNYLENFKILWPVYVPAFVRIEENKGEQYVSDILKKQQLQQREIGGRKFTQINFPENYNAFWIMPAKELKESIKKDFVRLDQGREFASSYVAWELGKPSLIEVENNKISKKCYSYHLPNNYINSDMPNAKIKVENVFI